MSEVLTETEVLIAGAGPTGLVLALWLTKLGVRVRIIDKAAARGAASRALAVQARTLEFYRQIGLAEAVVQAGRKVGAMKLWVGGAPVTEVNLHDIGLGLGPSTTCSSTPRTSTRPCWKPPWPRPASPSTAASS